YAANREAADDVALEASVVAGPLQDFLATTGAWTGTASELLAALTTTVAEAIRRKREWPKTATALGGQLRRLAPTLPTVGVEATFNRDARRRMITLTLMKPGMAPSSASTTS